MIVLDTHALLWWVEGDDRLPDHVRDRLDRTRSSDVAVSSISLWEIVLKSRRGALDLGVDARDWVSDVLATERLGCIPIDATIAAVAAGFEGVWTDNRDPADRFIVATALDRDAELVSGDAKIAGFAPSIELSILWGIADA